MPIVNTRHAVYEALLPRWEMVRDASEGEVAVKAQGAMYLPMLDKQETSEYNAYKMRALFFEATRRTLNGLVGMVTKKMPTITASESTKEGFLQSVTKDGQSIVALISIVMREVLMLNKYGIMADLPDVISKDAEPWLIGYTAESMINWQFGVDSTGKKALIRMVLEEEYEQADPEDRFKRTVKTQWRVLEMVNREEAIVDLLDAQWTHVVMPNAPAGTTDIYRVQVWRFKEDSEVAAAAANSAASEEFIIHDMFFPAFQGTGMDKIPFVIVTAEDEDKEAQKPPLEGLASVNMSHYRTSADLEHGRHYTALPTPYVIGLSEMQELTIGSSKAWVIVGAGKQEVEVGMLEFKGEGLKALETGMVEKQQQMAILGARLLEESKKSPEAFETHQLRGAGEHSILAAVTNGVSEGINEALLFMFEWDPSLSEMEIQLNTDFISLGMTPQFLTALVNSLQGSRMSFKTFYFNMAQRGMYIDGWTEEDELKQIEDDAAAAAEGEIDDLEDDESDEDEDEADEEEESNDN